MPTRSQPPQYPLNRPSYPNQSNQLRQITDRQSNGPPAQPRAYWAEAEEDYNDYTYDAPSDAWIAVPGHPPGHTPRRWGNTQPIGRLQGRTIGALTEVAHTTINGSKPYSRSTPLIYEQIILNPPHKEE